MRKTLALLLVSAFLYLAVQPPITSKSASLAAPPVKFYTVPNPIPGRYIVVLATTDLSPIAAPAATPVVAKSTTKSFDGSADSANTAASFSPDSATFFAAPAPDPSVSATATDLTNTYGGTFSLTWSDALKGFRLHSTEAQAISMSNDSRVAFVVEDGAIAVGSPDGDPILMSPDQGPYQGAFEIPQPNASWGLDRIDQRELPLSRTYTYTNSGVGVNAYVIDTGILPTHWEFGGRAAAIYDAVDREGNGIDCNGHGSHVAGIIGGQTFGVAKDARLFGVRVLNCQGAGTWSDVIDGVNYVTWHRRQPAQQGYPAVANMSLAGETNRAADAAVRNSIRAGVTYVVAAGNSNSDASLYSPAGLPEAITVGATNPFDTRATFSNYGLTLDLFAPGVAIPSAWIGDNNLMIAYASGTSMAAPHVAGVVALYLQTNRTAAPAIVRTAVVGTSTLGVIINPGEASPNRLLFTNY
jgi:subtilisin family serine protease